MKSKTNILIIIGIILIWIICYNVFFNKGYYQITDMWIGNTSQTSNYSYCDNCLWIEFDEGCNRRFSYYFENQHEYDKRLDIGTAVDIYFREVDGKKYIQHIKPRTKYDYKCS